MDSYQRSQSGNGAPNGTSPHPGIGQRVDLIGNTAQQLWAEARGAVSDIGQTIDLKGRLERNPYGTLAALVGIGYVLGGGLFTPLTARVVRFGVRLAALPFVKDELLNIAEAAVAGAGGAPPNPEPSGGGTRTP